MKKILFISDTPLTAKSGGGTNGYMHYKIIKSLGSNNTFFLFICSDSDKMISDNEFLLKQSNAKEKIFSAIKGYPPYLSNRVQKKVYDVIETNHINIVYIYNSISGNLVKNIKKRYPNITVITFFHDIEVILMKEQMKNTNLLRKLSLRLMMENEKKTVQYADKTIVLNKRDANQYYQCYGKFPDIIIPIIVPIVEDIDIKFEHIPGETLKLLFVGVDYGPNVKGIRWFIDNVLALLTCNCELSIVGRGMEKYKEEFEKKKNVIVYGTVESLSSYYKDADVVIAPIFEGGGMKVKTAEALSYGKIVVGTEESLTGYIDTLPENLVGNGIYCCKTAIAFSSVINELVGQRFFKSQIEIINWMIREYSYETNLKRFRTILDSII